MSDYLVVVEREFTRLRGGAPMLTPADWEVARGWEKRGVPLDAALEGIRSSLGRRLRPSLRTALRECETAVNAAHRARKRRAAGTAATLPEPSSAAPGGTEASGPDAAAGGLPAELAGWRTPRVLGLAPDAAARLEATVHAEAARIAAETPGAPGASSRELASIERDLLARLAALLPAETVTEVRRSANEALAAHRGRMPEAVWRESFGRAVRRRIARKLRLPDFGSGA